MPAINKQLLSIGFPQTNKAQGPKIFLSRLRMSIKKQCLARTTHFLIPGHDIDLFSSIARDYLRRPFVLRLDGICIDQELSQKERARRNLPVFRSMDRAKGIVYQSAFSQRMVEYAHTARSIPHVIIPNGVDLEHFSPTGPDMRAALGITKESRVLITAASWRAHKRLEDTVNVFKYLVRTDPSLRLIVLGSGLQSVPIVEGVIYAGFIPPSQLPLWYRTADVFVFLSWLDSCPNTVVEAIGCGLPVICTNQGGTRELVQRANAGIVVETDPLIESFPVALYTPPLVDVPMVAAAVRDVLTNLAGYRDQLNRDSLDINQAACDYVRFIKQCLFD